MNENRRRARAALFVLKEAVLDVLFDAQNEDPLQAADISQRLDIDRPRAPEAGNTVILGVLLHLQDEGRVQYVADGDDEQRISGQETSGWILTG